MIFVNHIIYYVFMSFVILTALYFPVKIVLFMASSMLRSVHKAFRRATIVK